MSWRHSLFEGVVCGVSSLVVVELAGGAAGSALVHVAVWALGPMGFGRLELLCLMRW
jgi:hypothetical protein